MLETMRAEAESKGAIVNMINVNDLSAKPCMGCMACRTSNRCVLPEDGSNQFLTLLQECDSVIIGAPCYWGNIPGQLKLLFDRMVYGMMRDTRTFPEPLMKGKKAIVVSTCTTQWPWNILFRQTRGVVRALKEILGYSGIKIVKTIERANTHKHKQFTDIDRKKCLKAVHKILN